AGLHNVAGAIDAQEGGYRAAERHFRAAIEHDARLEVAYLNLGRLYQEHATDDPDAPRKGLDIYRALLRIDPSSAEALFQAAYLNACIGDWSASRALIDRLPLAVRSRPQALVVLAVDLAGLGQPLRASEAAAT